MQTFLTTSVFTVFAFENETMKSNIEPFTNDNELFQFKENFSQLDKMAF